MNTQHTAAPAAVYNRGIAKLVFMGKILGYVKKGSFKLNGTKAEYSPLEAEQVPDAPVDYLVTKGPSIKPTFSLIQTDYQTLLDTIGGSSKTEGEGVDAKVVGWNAPVGLEVPKGEFELHFYTGKVLPIPDAILVSALTGEVTFTAPIEIECELLPIKSLTDAQKSTYGIYDSYTSTAGGAQAASANGGQPVVDPVADGGLSAAPQGAPASAPTSGTFSSSSTTKK